MESFCQRWSTGKFDFTHMTIHDITVCANWMRVFLRCDAAFQVWSHSDEHRQSFITSEAARAYQSDLAHLTSTCTCTASDHAHTRRNLVIGGWLSEKPVVLEERRQRFFHEPGPENHRRAFQSQAAGGQASDAASASSWVWRYRWACHAVACSWLLCPEGFWWTPRCLLRMTLDPAALQMSASARSSA